MNVIKRNGKEVTFDSGKIIEAIRKANNSVEEFERIDKASAEAIANDIEEFAKEIGHALDIETIQDKVVEGIDAAGCHKLAREYAVYRYKKQLIRKANTTDESVLSLLERNNEEAKQENSNKNPVVNSTQRDYMAGEVSRDITRRLLLPQDIVDAHEQGIIHFHDSDYFAQHMHNCCLVNLEDMLQNGTVITGTAIHKPHRLRTACNIATQVIAQIASNQYGGQTISLAHLVPFIDISRQRYIKKHKKAMEKAGITVTDEQLEVMVNADLSEEITESVQLIQYQLITLMTTNGQAPFVSVYMDYNEVSEEMQDDMDLLVREVLRQRIEGVPNEKGQMVTPAFPKLLYVLDECNTYEGSKYYDTTVLAAKCTAKRMVPDYISAKMMRELKNGDVYGCMGCRSFLTVDDGTANAGNKSGAKNWKEGDHKYYGRFNQGVVTLNLVDCGLSAHGDMDKFWEIMEERSELVHRALRLRHERLLGTPSDVAPILWQNGGLARLEKGEVIDPLLYGNYSTISFGYAGLYECVKAMTGHSHTDPEAEEFALSVMKFMNDKCAKWKAEENISYSIYGTPLESTTYRFAKHLQDRFGIIEGITDKNYITNSYHVHVTEEIDAFTKLKFESKFQALSPGGAISYVEVPNMNDNIDAVISIIQYMYENIMYAELNTKSDFCQCCGSTSEIQIVEDENGKLIWKCPQCGNTDEDKMNIARRTCGYIGTYGWNQGRTQEIKERFVHVSISKMHPKTAVNGVA